MNFQFVCSLIQILSIVGQRQGVVALLKGFTTSFGNRKRVGNARNLRIDELNRRNIHVVLLFKGLVDVNLAKHIDKVCCLVAVLVFVFDRYDGAFLVYQFYVGSFELVCNSIEIVYHKRVIHFGIVVIPFVGISQFYRKTHSVLCKPVSVFESYSSLFNVYSCVGQHSVFCIVINRHILFLVVRYNALVFEQLDVYRHSNRLRLIQIQINLERSFVIYVHVSHVQPLVVGNMEIQCLDCPFDHRQRLNCSNLVLEIDFVLVVDEVVHHRHISQQLVVALD